MRRSSGYVERKASSRQAIDVWSAGSRREEEGPLPAILDEGRESLCRLQMKKKERAGSKSNTNERRKKKERKSDSSMVRYFHFFLLVSLSLSLSLSLPACRHLSLALFLSFVPQVLPVSLLSPLLMMMTLPSPLSPPTDAAAAASTAAAKPPSSSSGPPSPRYRMSAWSLLESVTYR